jgi:hypothetical protein
MENKTPSLFKTVDLGLAAYLLYQNMTLLGCVDAGSGGRLFFVFTDDPARDVLTEQFMTGQDSVSASRYFRSLRRCKAALREPVK